MSFFGNLSSIFQTANKGDKKSGASTTLAATQPKSGHSASKPGATQVQPVESRFKKQLAAQSGPKPGKVTGSPTQPQQTTKQGPTAEEIRAAEHAAREAQSRAKEIIVEAKDEALAIRTKAEQEAREVRRDLEEQQRSINLKLDKIEARLNQMDEREKQVEKGKQEILNARAALEDSKQKVLEQLERVSGMTHDEAKAALFEGLEKKLSKEMSTLIRQKEEEAKNDADKRVQEILADAMKHGANDYVVEYTVSTVQLGSEEDKGRIIGKAGRNIHAFERATGVDVDLDVSPTAVRLSCFDSVRREIARISLERLVKDGRIQPSRIEEVVKKVASELDKIMFEEGRKLCHEVGVYNMPTELMALLGRFKYRFSYGQNLIGHTLEETRIGIKIAHELKADVNIVKLGCLLHDIGKVSMDEEGSHVELGVKIAKKYGMPQGVIDCIAQHHEDEPFTSVESMVVYAADAISGARPGARYENYEEYVQRLQKLEQIAMEYPEVEQAYAIQAGREVRVILVPEKSKDDDVQVLAVKIRDRIKNEVTYPGTVTVTVIRETRDYQVAK
jgi:ribonucrease Y